MKLAWTAVVGSPARVAEAVERLELLTDSFLSPGTPVQVALPELLAVGDDVRRHIQARLTNNLTTLDTLLGPQSALSRLKVEGGWTVILQLPRTRSDIEWAMVLLTQDALHVHPGHFFDLPREAMLVVSLLTPEDTFATGMLRLIDRVTQHG